MKKTSTQEWVPFKKCLVLFLMIFGLSFSQTLLAHSVTGYTTSCNTGPNYSIQPIVTNVNTSSNYGWQYKNASGVWVCIVNGNNTINGSTYSVSGASYTLTTTPGPIVFNNPNSGLQGLVIRCVISDGAGVNPCSMPAGNTYNSDAASVNQTISVSGTPCGNTPGSGSIGDRVWFDANGNGLQDAGETTGITGVTIQLKNSAGTVIATTNSNGSGNYIFNNLPAGSYTVVFPVSISGAVVTAQHVGTDVNIDSDPNQTTGITQVITLLAGQNITNIDAGYCPTTLALGNRVWYDANNNGLNDGENGIANITVNLYKDDNNDNVADGPSIATLTTDANGYYLFTNLSAGNYIVGVIIPPGYMSSSINGGDPDNDINLDDNGQVLVGNEIRGLGITLIAGTEPDGTNTNTDTNITYDFGLLPDCSCTTGAGNLLVNGSFENGTTGWSWSGGTLTTGTGYIACGAANGFNNWSSGTSKVWQDIAVAPGASITFKGFAGTHTAGISCSPKLSLIFLNASNTVLSQSDVVVTRDVDVNFSQLAQYIISAVAPAGTTKVRVQSSITCNTMKIDAFCLTVAPNCPGDGTWNLNYPNGTLGTSQAYNVNGFTVTAYGFNNGNPGTPTALYGKNAGGDENGLGINSNPDFEIDNTHFVQLDLNQIIAAGINSGTMSIGSMQAGEPANVYGSNTLGTIGTLLMTVPITLDNTPFPIPGFPMYRYISVQASAPSPANVLLQQVSFTCPSLGSIGDRVWKDDNGNGIQDAGEVGIAGVTLVLLNSAGQVVGTTTTDAFGNYKFSNLAPGNYSVRITPPANYSLSAKTQGADTNLDSDFDPTSYTTGTVTLTAGQNRTDIDAGLKFTQPSTASVGDRVWLDTNGDGVQDAGEPGVSNVLVTLYNSAGAAVRSTYTDVNGLYLFTDVTPGSYTVGVSLPPAFVFSPNNGVISGATNSDIIPATGRTASFTVNAGDQITYVDAGIKNQVITNGSIGDFVWNDINKNGIQDAGEPGIAGVTVRLVNATTNAVIATTTTDATGKYIFNDVPAGSYQVEFVTPAGYTTTTKLSTNPLSSNTDSDVDPATSRSSAFTLTAGQRTTYVDAGYWLTTPPGTAKLGDRVWLDANQNGIQDAGEPGVAGMTVVLYDGGGVAIKQTVTDANGLYLFTDLAAGNYSVGFSNVPAGFTFTTQGAGTAATGSDANPATGKTATIALAAGQVNLDVDAGIRSSMAGTASIGNRVWNDLNNNGLQDAGEVGVQGVTVELLDANGNPIDKDPVTPGVQPTTTVTNALGEYLFTGLPAGDYKVRFSTLPVGYNPVTKGAGTDRNIDSDGNPVSGGTSTTDVISVAAGEERLDIDLGLFNPTAPLGQLGDFVWFDSNNNGVQDAGEQGVPGVTVRLLNTTGTVLNSTVTDGSGLYKFVNLADGTYLIQFGNLPAGFSFSPKDLGGNDNTDSDADPTTGVTGTYTITAGSSNMTVDAGIYSTRAALGDYVWFDANNNGTQDAGEKGIAGITVTLYDAANVAVTSAITDQNGRYFFSNLNAGTYTVGFGTIPTKLIFTTKDVVAAGDAADSDVDPATGKTGSYTLAAGQVNLTVDAGLRPFIPATVGDFVWYDVNGNGLQDAGEPGVPGVVVTLYNSANQPIGSAITDGNGFYLISNVPPGTGDYVKFSNKPDAANSPWTLQNVGGAAANNNSKADATGQTGTFSVAEGQNITNIDAGITRLASLGDRVWKDDNGNGIQDAGEVGVAGVTITLLNSAGQVVGTTTTDAFGIYKFSNLAPGDYTVRITPPANYSLSAKSQGGNTNLDSDFDPTSYTTGTVTMAGVDRTDIDAGLKFAQPSTASVGDRVWLDTNGDGVQDAGEPGVSNVLVTLYNSVGAAVRSTYTDINGLYLFTDVTPGSYTVGVSLPPAFVFSPNNGVISGATNSDIIPATGRTASFTVNAGDQITYVDAGIKNQVITNGSIGDFVWNDINKNGIQDAGEPGIAGVTVRLVNATTNAVIATTTTDATGKYIFNDVPAGSYQVEFVTPAGYTTTTKLSTDPLSSNTDSDVDPATSRSSAFTLTAGQRTTYVDAGYWLTTPPGTAKLGDYVWNDLNQNGIQDAGEPGVAGMTVVLYDGGGVAIKQAVTDANGLYIFTDLAAGNYSVGFSNVPAGFTFTTQGSGTAATGSDANPATGKTATIALAAGQVNLDVDAGIRSSMAGTASIGNRVWNDLNNNGLQDAGEVGVQGVTVELLDANGNPIDKDPVTPGVQPTTTVTNALGEYLFTGLAAGDYKVRFSTLPVGYNPVTKGAGTDRNIDSDGNPVSGGTSTTDVISVAAGEERLDIDLGLFNPTAPLGQLGDFVWFDSNNNGVQDAGEQGVPGVTVSLLNAAGVVINTTVTDGNGLYKFVNLADGTYSVKFSNLPAGFVFSPKDLGGNDNTDSDADPSTGVTGTYTITAGNSNMTVDAGIYSTRAALGDYVWFDGNNNGTQDATEKGIAGVTVILYDAAGAPVTSMITDQNGRYFFSNLNPGTYTVGFGTTPTKLIFTTKDVVAAGDAADSDVDPATGKTGSYTLAAGQVNLTVDAGLRPFIPATIGDFVWYDLNRDGIQTPGEPGIPGVVVTLYNSANQPIGSAVTDGNGFYQISNVTPGTGYYVKFSNQPDLTAPWTLQNVGGAAAADNSKVDATGTTGAFNVAEGDNITNLDAGLIKIFNLSGNVWHDVNGMNDNLVNDTRNTVSPPAAIIPTGLRISRVDAVTGVVLGVALVQGNGAFNFPNVAPGNYILILSPVPGTVGQLAPFSSLPAGWVNTGEHLGLTPGRDPVVNGKLSVSVTTSSVTNANFGIQLNNDDIGIN